MRPVKPLAERVFAKVDKSGDCWKWQGALNGCGYGVIGLGRRGMGNGLVHRIVYQLCVGPIPEGHDLDHLCRNRACCNPDHLEPVTRQVNVDRGLRAKGYRDHIITCSRGHEYDHHNGKQRICRECHRQDASTSVARRRTAA